MVIVFSTMNTKPVMRLTISHGVAATGSSYSLWENVDEGATCYCNFATVCVDTAAIEKPKPPRVPWWDCNDVPPDLSFRGSANMNEPRVCFRPFRAPGLSGKRTTASQRIHNRKAA